MSEAQRGKRKGIIQSCLALLILSFSTLSLFLPYIHADFYAEDLPTIVALSKTSLKHPLAVYAAEGVAVTAGTFLETANIEQVHYFRPLLPFALYGIQKVAHFRPTLFRIVNILLHLATGLLLFRILFQLSSSAGLSVGLALLFLISPGRSYPVMRIVTLSTIMALFFSFLALSLFMERKSYPAYLCGALAALLATLSKETAFLFLPMLAFYLFLRKEAKWSVVLILLFIFYLLLRLLFRASFLPLHSCPPYLISLFEIVYVPHFFQVVGTYLVYTFLPVVSVAELTNWQAAFPHPMHPFFGLLAIVLFGVGIAFLLRNHPSRKDIFPFLGFLLGALFPATLTVPSLTELYFPAGWLMLFLGIALSKHHFAWRRGTFLPQLLLFSAYASLFFLRAVQLNSSYVRWLSSGRSSLGQTLQKLPSAGQGKHVFLVNIPEEWVIGITQTLQHDVGEEWSFSLLTAAQRNDPSPVKIELRGKESVVIRRASPFFNTLVETAGLCQRNEFQREVFTTPTFTSIGLPQDKGQHRVQVRFKKPLQKGDIFLLWDTASNQGKLWKPRLN